MGRGESDVEIAAVGEVGEFKTSAVAEEEIAEDGILTWKIFLDSWRGNSRSGEFDASDGTLRGEAKRGRRESFELVDPGVVGVTGKNDEFFV